MKAFVVVVTFSLGSHSGDVLFEQHRTAYTQQADCEAKRRAEEASWKARTTWPKPDKVRCVPITIKP